MTLTLDRLAVYDEYDRPFPPETLRDVLDERLDCEVAVVDDVDVVGEFDAVITKTHRDAYLDAVEWVHTFRSGYDGFSLDDYRDRGVVLTNSTGAQGDVVGETVVGYLLAFARGLDAYLDRDRWERLPWERPFTIARSSLCVVGLGQLGTNVASRAGVLGMDVEGVDVRPVAALGVDDVHDVSRIREAIRDVRFVVLTTPLTPDTRGLVGEEELATMRDDAYLINVSRGEIVDEDALVAALETGEIAGAALDVFHEEPLPDDHPLWEMDNVIATPHVAAHANHYVETMSDLIETNATLLQDGDDPWNQLA